MSYTFHPSRYNEETVRRYSIFLSEVFPKAFTPALIDWQYNQNPVGKVVGCDAFFNGELVAHYAGIPVEYCYGEEKIKGLLSLNTATHPRHQGNGLFVKLANQTYAYGAALGYKFVIGVANKNSSHGFLNHLGFTLIAPLCVETYARKPMIINVPTKMIQSSWCLETLRWRLEKPGSNYYYNNLCPISKTHISFIDAVLSNRETGPKIALPEKKSLLKMNIGLNFSNKFKINLPDFLKPSPLNLIFKPLGDFNVDINQSNLYFELIDFDAY